MWWTMKVNQNITILAECDIQYSKYMIGIFRILLRRKIILHFCLIATHMSQLIPASTSKSQRRTDQ